MTFFDIVVYIGFSIGHFDPGISKDTAECKPECTDDPQWKDGVGKTCDWYAKSKVCVNGHVVGSWDGGEGYAPEFYCCVCGRQPSPCINDSKDFLKCTDSPDWKDGVGKTCEWYANSGVCANGHVLSSWEYGVGYSPEINCCACGRARHKPNVIMLVQESGAAQMMCHYMSNARNVYKFVHGNTVSGNTAEAMPSLMTGLLPIVEGGYDAMYSIFLGDEFKRIGYSTSTFQSWAWKDLNKGVKFNMENLTYFGMDTILHGGFAHHERMDDRAVVKHFISWLQECTRPFFTLIQVQNQHAPFRADESATAGNTLERYISSLKTFDEALQILFLALKERQVLEDTIILSSGDHGTTYGYTKPTHARNH